LQLKSS